MPGDERDDDVGGVAVKVLSSPAAEGCGSHHGTMTVTGGMGHPTGAEWSGSMAFPSTRS
jgi:hypothetical protein